VRNWRGLIALVLAAGVSIALISGVLTAELTPRKVTSEEIAFLSTLGGAAVGAIAAYLGNHTTDRSDMTDDPQDPTEPTEPEPDPTEPEPTPGPLVDPAEPIDPGKHEVETPTLDDGEAEDVGPDTE
jgi:hypothetical protein